MAIQIDLSSEFNLPSELNLSLEEGRIHLSDQRMIMLHIGAMGSLRKELIETLGIERARGLLTRMGYASGVRDAKLARKLMPNASDEELMLMGPKLHMVEGIVKVSPIKIDVDIANGRYFGDLIWEHSYEADVHIEQFGVHTESVCWTQIGYATGYTSEIVGRFILYKEPECCGMGDRHCRNVGKPVEEWEGNVEEDLKYFNPDHIADQLLKLQEEVAHLRYSLDEETAPGDMVGSAPPFLKTCEMLKKAGESNVTVLLLGETGVGKEMFARALHSISSRAERNFIAINCAAIPESLIESELFGVEKGAYTGAQHSRPGRFERAHGGTLFLDEVGELSPAAQAKLLRVLQEGEFERIGDSRTRKVNVRLVAATNVDLQQAVDAGKFRADLYYRLNIFPILIPALREREDDIPALVNRFLEKYTALHGKRTPGITERALRALRNYDWPGNIRELENIIERGVIITANDTHIDLPNLFPELSVEPAATAQTQTSTLADSPSPQNSGLLFDRMLDQILEQNIPLGTVENRLLDRAVERARGNLASAGRMLGLTRPQMAYRLKKYSTP
ncbi:MAG: sigma 54-interacting transcriptional regulator [Candidatus Thiodiazotropha weberae]|uniref:sigma-54-dependent Fis family transcriptional regulator n=1 Tax=Candidatus Thiodiazotropha endoloripes TaxID=1818881 RepID=UPI00083E2209|nr:sigma-54-dependent Fis family transcriptional regulator [Candidatus Thiodiazotropha endoloripes]MCG7899493.1 sigma 54-interacting transcriptional regulator [Candidatus Thiodiazotropha weberae]ODB87598.1 sigma-54-dependent Fis family transcriptional regulator [Candidatus Thiodiazotropha endoloripes]ODB90051.1 sigma-54-dependent Fis family transcriptional regulator [Candidatus Thiodiazotropha endoloripes]ODB92240.1 sigma-54-dependent Fis family transcriptional regulator [Candidatus Thiodiazotr